MEIWTRAKLVDKMNAILLKLVLPCLIRASSNKSIMLWSNYSAMRDNNFLGDVDSEFLKNKEKCK
jgi:hypothetical protein